MWKSQGGCCPICSTKLVNIEIDGEVKNKGNTACVDHCHETGKVRGILCAKCNKALGLFNDNLISLQNAFNYIDYHKPEIH